MASLVLEAQLSNGSWLTPEATDRFWANGAQFQQPVFQDTYQSSTHLTTQSNDEECGPNHLSGLHLFNTKRVAANTVSIQGATAVPLPVPLGACPLRYTFSHDVPAVITAAQFYVYNGIEDTVPISSLSFYAAEGNVSANWVVATSRSSALTLAPRPTPALEHEFFIAFSASPTNLGEKTGKFKLLLTWDVP